MTVGTKIQQTLASLEGAAANLRTFSLDTQNQAAKQMYQQYAQQTEQIAQAIRQRVQEIQSEEPQYRQS